MYVGTLVVNSDKVALGDAQLLKRMRVLRILDLSYQVEDFQVVNGIPFVDVSLSCSLIATPGLVADLEDGGIGVQGRHRKVWHGQPLCVAFVASLFEGFDTTRQAG
mmetsp:Transcript_66078/g.147526  ORF Transcript_66078/g.147526 Transcript_66078/m.147526 type:complete len:106 (-) Transcript_66078:11-328(-)